MDKPNKIVELQDKIEEARNKMEYHFIQLDQLERTIASYVDQLEKINQTKSTSDE